MEAAVVRRYCGAILQLPLPLLLRFPDLSWSLLVLTPSMGTAVSDQSCRRLS